MAQPDATATPQQNNLPVPQQGTPGTGLEQLAEALGITKDGLSEGAYPPAAMSTATQQTNQMPTRPAPQLRQAPGMSLDQLLQAAQFAVGNPDVAVQAARELPGGVGGVAELLPASDLERALELGGPLLGMAGPVVRAGKKAAQAARSVAQRLHPLEKKMLDTHQSVKSDRTGFILSDGSEVPWISDDLRGHDGMAEDIGSSLGQFLDKTDAIRVMEAANQGELALLAQAPPRPPQTRAIADLFKRGGFDTISLQIGDHRTGTYETFNTIGEMQRFFEGQ